MADADQDTENTVSTRGTTCRSATSSLFVLSPPTHHHPAYEYVPVSHFDFGCPQLVRGGPDVNPIIDDPAVSPMQLRDHAPGVACLHWFRALCSRLLHLLHLLHGQRGHTSAAVARACRLVLFRCPKTCVRASPQLTLNAA